MPVTFERQWEQAKVALEDAIRNHHEAQAQASALSRQAQETCVRAGVARRENKAEWEKHITDAFRFAFDAQKAWQKASKTVWFMVEAKEAEIQAYNRIIPFKEGA